MYFDVGNMGLIHRWPYHCSLLYVVIITLLFCFTIRVESVTRPTSITINNNGYKNILVAIKPDVPENPRLIDYIKDMFNEGSSYLYTATENRAFFEEVTILVPSTWGYQRAWDKASSELYSNADIIVQDPTKDPNKRRKRSDSSGATYTAFHRGVGGASTRSYGGCGTHGERIHIFTDIFGTIGKLTYGPSGRVLVHEWAKFRYGVFDEFAHDGEPHFYFSPSTGNLEAVRCNINMVGRIYRINETSNQAVICHLVDPLTGTYDDTCRFDPYTLGHYNDNITASIMDRTKVPTITQFCNENLADPKRVHNYESPSRHNRICGGKSTWTVIMESPDFFASNNPPRAGVNTRVLFKVVRTEQASRLMLAIDTSNSMHIDGKLSRATEAATTFIEDGLEKGAHMGIVTFDSEAKIAANVSKIRNDQDRKALAAALPKSGSGATSIGAALLKCIEALKLHNPNASDAYIVLITDGRQNFGLSVLSVLKKVLKDRPVISVIAMSEDNEEFLQQLASLTGGRFFFDISNKASTSVMESILSIYRFMHAGRSHDVPIQVMSENRMLYGSDSMAGRFYIHPSLGRNTGIILTYSDPSPPNITIVSPSGRRYCSLYPEYDLQAARKRIRIKIPFVAEAGHYTYGVENAGDKSTQITLTVLSFTKDAYGDTLQLSGHMVAVNNTWPIMSSIYASVTRGNMILTDLIVKAMVIRPNAEPVSLDLFDNGVGADLVKGDGIYSRYFTRFSTVGRYSVNIVIANDEGAMLIAGRLEERPSLVASANAGSIHIQHKKLPSSPAPALEVFDDYPPMRIRDLRVLHTCSVNGTVALAWSAPGDDNDYDQASGYVIVASFSAEALIKNIDLPAIDSKQITKGYLDQPRPFGSTELFEMKMHIPENGKAAYVFGVFAVDEVGNKGDMSNIVTVGFGYVPDISTSEYLDKRHMWDEEVSDGPPPQQALAIIVVLGIFSTLLALSILFSFVMCVCQKFRSKNLERLSYVIHHNSKRELNAI